MRLIFHALLIGFLALIVSTQPAWARALNPSERASLDLRKKEFVASIRSGNYADALRIIPPRILSKIAQQFAASEEELIASLNYEAKDSLSGITFLQMVFPTNGIDFVDEVVSGGQTITWAYANYSGTLRIDGTKHSFKSPALIIRGAGQWYLIRSTPAQLDLVQSVYPFIPAPPQ